MEDDVVLIASPRKACSWVLRTLCDAKCDVVFSDLTILGGVDEMWGDKRFEKRGRGASQVSLASG